MHFFYSYYNLKKYILILIDVFHVHVFILIDVFMFMYLFLSLCTSIQLHTRFNRMASAKNVFFTVPVIIAYSSGLSMISNFIKKLSSLQHCTQLMLYSYYFSPIKSYRKIMWNASLKQSIGHLNEISFRTEELTSLILYHLKVYLHSFFDKLNIGIARDIKILNKFKKNTDPKRCLYLGTRLDGPVASSPLSRGLDSRSPIATNCDLRHYRYCIVRKHWIIDSK